MEKSKITPLPKSREQYLESIANIKRDLLSNTHPNGAATVQMLGLLVEAIVDLKDATEIPYDEYETQPYGAEFIDEPEL